MKLTIWDVLSIVVLAAALVLGLLFWQLYQNPWREWNPLQPPTYTPTPTATLQSLPPTWTPQPTASLLPSPTRRPTQTFVPTETQFQAAITQPADMILATVTPEP